MRDRAFLTSQRYRDQQSRAAREGAHPDILEFEKRFIARLRKQHNVPMFAHCVWRDESEQARLYVQGYSKARFGESAHNYGMAADLIHSTMAWNLDPKSWGVLGHIGKEISVQSGIAITWGGDWKFFDPAHWELEDWQTLVRLKPMLPGQPWLI